jgi:gamma-glutamyl-gamma-aminobutyrate hydrolase PuuD
MYASALYLDKHFGECEVVRDPQDLKNQKALVLWGGEDISPSIYGQKSVYAHATDKPSQRDALEIALVNRAVDLGMPILGICRGAQLLCALDGGTLWQHVDNHAGWDHKITVRGHTYNTNSYHHQMMRPSKDAEVIGTSLHVLSSVKCSEKEELTGLDPECEIVWFPKLRALGVQGHPEWLPKKHDLNYLTKSLFEEKTNVAL